MVVGEEWYLKYVARKKDWSLENCMKGRETYIHVQGGRQEKKSAGINHICGREVYAGWSMWSCNEDVQKCVVHYEVTKMQMGTEELKTGSVEKSLFKLISSKNHNSLHIIISPYNFIVLPFLAR